MSNLAYISQPDETVATIASNVRAEIARQGMTDAQFAARFGISAMGASRRLAGRTPFTTTEVARVAAFFGLEVGDLYKRVTHPAPVGPAGFEPAASTVESQRFEVVSLAERRERKAVA